ncbi:MAG: glucosamine--fructose-6-phosphate aminotransferase, isomerizing [Paenibacillus sp.]|nr:glucosamine--fructose-6-phosphate aminotransferase, isomerizing [Paenibacillus sp.]
MCNIAGYVGERRAAPILIDMMRRQEGFGGGYYTGIATISEGKLHYAKVVGDLERLLAETDALHLPGTIGLLHSRSNSGGGRPYAHPFIGCGGKLAYVANGSTGLYGTEANKRKFGQAADELERKGYVFDSKSAELKIYVPLSDGTVIHMSDLMCQMIASYIDTGHGHAAAMASAFAALPSEIVGLMIHADRPDRIVASRINMPMMIGRAANETFLATAAIAFPDEVADEHIAMLPPASTAEVLSSRYIVTEQRPAVDPVADISAKLWREAYERAEAALAGQEEKPKRVADIVKVLEDLKPKEQAAQLAMVAYEVLRSLKRDNRLGITTVTVPGAQAGITSPQFRMYLTR